MGASKSALDPIQTTDPPDTAESGPSDLIGITMPSAGSSGAGGAPSEAPAPPAFCDAPTKVLVASCGNGSCHSNPGWPEGDFAVDTERAYNFVDKDSVRHAYCGRIIDSRDYSKSLMLTKVRGSFPSPDCGGRMPIGSFVITEEQIDCLASWLQQFQQ
ncbi:MAG TPA: hypothetical protein VFS67_06545 [Polyangiaceae bacterium]|nr:hypothetical protein [Polyangiaceae bacterium]